MVVYALVSSQARETVELYLSRGDAEADLRLIEADEPELAALLTVVVVDFDYTVPRSLN